MDAFWSGVAIGLGISAVLAIVFGAIFLIVWIGEWIIAIIWGFALAAREGMRAIRADIRDARTRRDAERAKLGLPPFNGWREVKASQRRAWRMLRHPIRERALVAESFRALKNPSTHKWSN